MTSQLKNKLYIFLAVLLAPVVPSIIYTITSIILGAPDTQTFYDVRAVFLLVYIVSLLLTLIVGFPLLLVVYYFFGIVRSWYAVLAGALVGTLFVIVLEDISFENIDKVYIADLLFFGVTGTLTGFAFWFILRLGKVNSRNVTEIESA